MIGSAEQIGTAVASPTKEFFVRMLTRDIELQDALLDLLDNCVDGIIRSGTISTDNSKPYAGFKATLTIAPDHFVIEDNCGGIPIEVAKKSAFAMGRPPATGTTAHGATVGMYGIGMKRAIFKLGTEALVESRHDTGFVVEFTPDWMRDDKWDELPMYELADSKLPEKGTRIEIYQLNDEVKSSFLDGSWIDEFRRTVARHYSLIIAKGFSVSVGSDAEMAAGVSPIDAEEFKLIRTTGGTDQRIAPYVYAGTLGDVEVEIFAGLYRELLSEEEGEEEEDTRGASDDAGWTVACNDRVVIWKDKSRLTGWGEATVPNYHGQFIAITGIVLLRCDDPKKLPLTTTKRGIDAASNVYSEAKDLMRDATKHLTSFTNKWKKFPQKLEEIYKASEYVDLPTLRSLPAALPMILSRKVEGIKKYEPKYPEPEQEKTSLRVSFVALKTDVATLAKHFFDDVRVKPGAVGEAAFNEALRATKAPEK
ncbi:ATP-binding protein [Aestuariivirga sp.]|uniref:ATP-binding protein n=1 Tax=Aestuariivirga sp. TaxID=2650926 RepID=UPI0025B8AA94|nr:ATP-binding protein [Aestuariivirga sp.]MCA3554090.1 ATP-binding protein [Aestuariivirga sp.]